MKPRRAFLAVLAGLCILAVGGCSTGPEAQVDGEIIAPSELNSVLRLAYGQPILQRLRVEHIIFDEARRKGVTLDESELRPYVAQAARIADPGLRRAADQELRAHLLLRKLVLMGYTTAHQRRLYDLFKDLLTQYRVTAIVTRNKADATATVAGLNAGFSGLAMTEKYGVDPVFKRRGGDLGFLTLEQIRATFGPLVAETVDAMGEHKVSPIFRSASGCLVIQTGHMRSTFVELRGSVQDLIVQGTAPSYLSELTRSALPRFAYQGAPPVAQLDALLRPIYASFAAPAEVAQADSDLPRVAEAKPQGDSSALGASVGEALGRKVPDSN